MGFKYRYSAGDMSNVVSIVNAIKHDACDMRSDGYVQWGSKQDLWRLKWIIDEALSQCPEFSIEEEWLREQGKKKVIRILKDEM